MLKTCIDSHHQGRGRCQVQRPQQKQLNSEQSLRHDGAQIASCKHAEGKWIFVLKLDKYCVLFEIHRLHLQSHYLKAASLIGRELMIIIFWLCNLTFISSMNSWVICSIGVLCKCKWRKIAIDGTMDCTAVHFYNWLYGRGSCWIRKQ